MTQILSTILSIIVWSQVKYIHSRRFYLCKVIHFIIYFIIDWLVFNANFSSISAISWREQIVFINLAITIFNTCIYIYLNMHLFTLMGRRGRMVVGFTTTCAISASHHKCSRRGVLDTILCDKVCQWPATGLWFSPGDTIYNVLSESYHWYIYNDLSVNDMIHWCSWHASSFYW